MYVISINIYINRYSILNIVNLESIPLLSVSYIFTNCTDICATIIISVTMPNILYFSITIATNIIFLSIASIVLIIIIALNNIISIIDRYFFTVVNYSFCWMNKYILLLLWLFVYLYMLYLLLL